MSNLNKIGHPLHYLQQSRQCPRYQIRVEESKICIKWWLLYFMSLWMTTWIKIEVDQFHLVPLFINKVLLQLVLHTLLFRHFIIKVIINYLQILFTGSSSSSNIHHRMLSFSLICRLLFQSIKNTSIHNIQIIIILICINNINHIFRRTKLSLKSHQHWIQQIVYWQGVME